MKKLLEKLFIVRPPIMEGMIYTSRREPMNITPEYQQWCNQFNVSILADRNSDNIRVLMGEKIKYVCLHT
jgi:hypothetical protein